MRRFSANFWPLSEDFQKLCKDYTNVVNIFWKFQKTFQKDPKILWLCTNTFKHSLRVNAISKKPSISYQATIWKICHLSSQCSFVHFTSSVFFSKKVYYLMRKVYSPLFGSWNEVPWDMGDLPIEPILVSQSLYTLRHHLGELSPSLRFLWHKFHLCLFFQLTGPGKRHNGNSKVMRL